MTGLMHCSNRASSLDHLVSAQQKRGWHCDAKRFGGPEIDHQLEFGGLHHWQVGGPLALENPADVDSDLAIDVRKAGSITQQPARSSILTAFIDGGNRVARGEDDELNAAIVEKRIGSD